MKISKIFSVIGATGEAAADAIGTLGTAIGAGKDALTSTVVNYQKETALEDAKNRILAKAKAVKELAKELNISFEQAEELLDQELDSTN